MNSRFAFGLSVHGLRSRKRFCRRIGCGVSFFMLTVSCSPAFAATAVLGGSATLEQATGATLTQNTDALAQFTSSSASSVLDWSKFNIGSGQEMNFDGAGTTFFNLVNATAGKSQIDGMISGNGNVWVINPNGIAFGANSTVNVGGLFAAAAGSIENADALRNGTAMLPSFSSFEGAVSSSSTSKFTADQVAMLGKTASVAGDFTGVSSLNIGAAGNMVVDEVSGGKISINVSAFADDPDSVGLELGDLNLGDVANGVNGGDLDAFSDRGISVKGDVTVGGNALVYNVENDIRVEKDASLVSTSVNMNEVNVYSAAYGNTGANGDIVIDGTVSADAEFGLGSVNIVAGKGEGNSGNATVNGTVSADYYAQTATRTGDVNVNGSISSTVEVSISTHDGDIKLGGKSEVSASGDYEMYGDEFMSAVGIFAAMDESGTGDVSIDGSVQAGGLGGVVMAAVGTNVMNPYLSGGNGDLNVNGAIGAGYVNMYSAKGNLNVTGSVLSKSGIDAVAGANMIIAKDANLISDGYNSSIRLAGSVISSESDVVVAGRIIASEVGGDVQISANNGNLKVFGSVEANDDILVRTVGNVIVDKDATIYSSGKGSNIDIVADSAGNSKSDVVIDGRLTADTVEVSASMLEGSRGDVVVNGMIDATGVSLCASTGEGAQGDICVAGHVESGHVNIKVGNGNAKTIQSGVISTSNGDISVDVDHGNVEIDGSIQSENLVFIKSAEGGINVGKEGSIRAKGENSGIYIVASDGHNTAGDIIIDGVLESKSNVLVNTASGEDSVGNVIVNGQVKADNEVGITTGSTDNLGRGDVTVSGSIEAKERISLAACFGNVSLVKDGIVSASGENGDVTIGTGLVKGCNGVVLVEGDIIASGDVTLIGGAVDGARGSIRFGATGHILSKSDIYVVTRSGDLIQDGTYISPAKNGYIEPVSIFSSMTGETINFKIDGNVGQAPGAFVAVDGKIFGFIEGDTFIAAANGKPLLGGENPDSKAIIWGDNSITITMGDIEEGSRLVTHGDLVLYTSSSIAPFGNFIARGDLIVSAGKFADVSYLRAGGKLTVNNVGKPAYPQIAYFESVNGVEPRINNLPNDTVIFVDGRLAGGNTQIINTFGANEAFMVQTPELKSTQGIFGNPTFMHSDLDVANPMEVGTIDYMIQDIPRLTLSTDFPAEVDRNIEANGLSARDSYWFGQEKANASNDDTEEPVDRKERTPEEDNDQKGNTLASLR